MTAPGNLRLERLSAHRLPGIPDGFTVTAAPGVNLVVGPNESGKSSLVRAVFQLLWPDTPTDAPCDLDGTFVSGDGNALRAVRAAGEPPAWSRDGEPAAAPTVPSGHLAHCYHLGLLDLNRHAGEAVDRDLARQVRRQMAGGYDLPAVRALFPDRSHVVTRRRRDWQAAEQAAAAVARAQRALAQEVRELDGLRADLATGQDAARRRDRLAAALAHHAATARLAELHLQRDALPAGTDRVQVGDDEALETLAKRLRAKARTADRLRASLTERRAELALLAVGEGLSGADRHVTAAVEAARTAADAERAVAAAGELLATCTVELTPELRETDAVPADAVARLRRAHADALAPEANGAALERLLEQEIFRTAGGASSPVTAFLAPAGALALAAAGAVLILRGEATAGLLLLVVGLLAGGAWWGMRARRRAASGVVDRLREGLEHRIAKVAAQARDVEEARTKLHRDLGGEGDPAAPDFLADLDRLDRYHAARADLVRARGAGTAAVAARDEAVQAAAEALSRLGEEDARTVPELQAALDNLRTRETRHAALRETIASDEAALAEAEADLADAEAEKDSLLARLDLPAFAAAAPDSGADAATAEGRLLHAIRERLAARETWQELARDLTAAEHEQKLARRKLDDVPADGDDAADALLAAAPADLEQRAAAAETAAARVEELIARIADIEGREREARAGQARETARGRADEAAAALHDAQLEERAGRFGNIVLDAVEERHAADHRTPLLTAADTHLDLFTAGRYRLRLAPGGSDDGFAVLDPTNRPRALSALSDGTRAQVLLAARLAFLTGTESEGALPLFLDEAMTASDPERFDAIAGALGRLAADTGRQVFYLTSNPADVAAWQRALAERGMPAPQVIDLAAARGLASAAPADDLELAPLPAVPTPDGEDAAAYGARLGVAPVQPWADDAELDLFHLWRDDLDLVHALARGRVRTVGQWRRLGPALLQAGLVTAKQQGRIDGRVALWSAWQEGWRIGRGRPVTGDVLAASGALSSAMLGPARDVLTAAHGDADTFMARVEAGEVKRLRADKKIALREYLEGEGHLDRRDVLDAAGLLAHVLASVAPRLHAGTLDPDEVRDLVAALTSAAAASD